MTIEFKIPNEIMKINADTFFQEAPRAKIRKMLKMLKSSGPDPEVVQELKDWLHREIQNAKATGRTGYWKISAMKLAERYEYILEIVEKLGL